MQQTIIVTTILIALIIITVSQHFAIRRLYKISQGQKAVNKSFSHSIQALSKDAMELRGRLNRKTGRATPMPELPYFIKQPKSRFISYTPTQPKLGGEPNAN